MAGEKGKVTSLDDRRQRKMEENKPTDVTVQVLLAGGVALKYEHTNSVEIMATDMNSILQIFQLHPKRDDEVRMAAEFNMDKVIGVQYVYDDFAESAKPKIVQE